MESTVRSCVRSLLHPQSEQAASAFSYRKSVENSGWVVFLIPELPQSAMKRYVTRVQKGNFNVRHYLSTH